MKSLQLLFALIIPLFLSCKEKELNPFYEAKSCIGNTSNEVALDSTISFVNCSDSINVSYYWDFGDGETSLESKPKHKYLNYGNYLVELITSINGINTDTSRATVNVSIGERYLDQSGWSEILNFAEGDDESIMAICRSDPKLIDAAKTYYLKKFDKNLRNIWTKEFEIDIGGSFKNIIKTFDGNFLLSGTYSTINPLSNPNFGPLQITKIDTSGKVIWNKKIVNSNGFSISLIETEQKELVVMNQEEHHIDGLGETVKLYVPVIYKLDERGNLIWKNIYNNKRYAHPGNLVEKGDGYFFTTGLTLNNSGRPNSLNVLFKINSNGQEYWNKTLEWKTEDPRTAGYNSGPSLMAISQDNILLSGPNQQLLLYNFEGDLISRSFVNLPRRFVLATQKNNFIRGVGSSHWDGIKIQKIDNDGDLIWLKKFGKRNKRCFPEHGYANKAKVLKNGEILIVGASEKECLNHRESSFYLAKINEDGETL